MAGDLRLDGDAVAGFESCNAGMGGDDGAARFVAEDVWGGEDHVADAPGFLEVHVGAGGGC